MPHEAACYSKGSDRTGTIASDCIRAITGRLFDLKPGLRTRSIFNRVQEIFASPSSSSSSKNFIFRVQVRQK